MPTRVLAVWHGQNPAGANIVARAYTCVKPVARGYRVLAKTTLTITKTSFENKLLHICEYLAIALISYDRILHNGGDVHYNYGLMCQPMDQIQRGSLYAHMIISCCHKLNVHGIVLKCVPHVQHAYFFTIRTIKFFLIYCLVIRSIYTDIKMGQTSIRSISVPHSSFEFILDQKA